MFRHYKIILFSFCLSSLASCYFGGGGYNTSNLSLFQSLPSVGEFASPSDSEYFYIDLDVERYRTAQDITPYYEISTTEAFGDAEQRDSPSNCEIPLILPEDPENDKEKIPSEEPLICILDVLEFDLMVKDLHIVYNFPHGMCDSVTVSLPWHFNHPLEIGPNVGECTRPSENEPEVENKHCNLNACADEISATHNVQCGTKYCDWNNNCQDNRDAPYLTPCRRTIEPEGTTGYCVKASASATDCPEPVTRCVETEDELCSPSYPVAGTEPIRCCYGGSKSDGSKWTPSEDCYGGPARIAEAPHDLDYNESFIADIKEGGLRQTITLPSLRSINNGLSVGDISISTSHANYLEALDVPPDTTVDRDADLPKFLERCDDCPLYKEPRLFFDFECIDSGKETPHLIRLMIREWNTEEEFLDFYADGGNEDADPDIEGEEGEDGECQYEIGNRIGDNPAQCNDLLDFKDVLNCDPDDYALCAYFIGGDSDNRHPRARYSPLSQ